MTKDISANTDPRVVRLFVVRHGRTDWNAQKILQGHLDVPMNRDGDEQAAKVGSYLQHVPLDSVVTLDLRRCTATASHIVQHHPHLAAVETAKLRERNMGKVQGMPLAEALRLHGENFRDFGEKEHELTARVGEVWDAAVKAAAAEGHTNVVLCTHGGVVTAFTNHLHAARGYRLADGLERGDLRVPYNTSVTVVDVDKATGAGVIQKFGVTEHLGGDFRVKNQLLR